MQVLITGHDWQRAWPLQARTELHGMRSGMCSCCTGCFGLQSLTRVPVLVHDAAGCVRTVRCRHGTVRLLAMHRTVHQPQQWVRCAGQCDFRIPRRVRPLPGD